MSLLNPLWRQSSFPAPQDDQHRTISTRWSAQYDQHWIISTERSAQDDQHRWSAQYDQHRIINTRWSAQDDQHRVISPISIGRSAQDDQHSMISTKLSAQNDQHRWSAQSMNTLGTLGWSTKAWSPAASQPRSPPSVEHKPESVGIFIDVGKFSTGILLLLKNSNILLLEKFLGVGYF